MGCCTTRIIPLLEANHNLPCCYSKRSAVMNNSVILTQCPTMVQLSSNTQARQAPLLMGLVFMSGEARGHRMPFTGISQAAYTCLELSLQLQRPSLDAHAPRQQKAFHCFIRLRKVRLTAFAAIV